MACSILLSRYPAFYYGVSMTWKLNYKFFNSIKRTKPKVMSSIQIFGPAIDREHRYTHENPKRKGMMCVMIMGFYGVRPMRAKTAKPKAQR